MDLVLRALIAFGDSLPLQGRRARALVVALLLAVWLAWLAWRLFKRDDNKPGPIARWRERRRKQREQAVAAAGLDAPRIAELHARFRDAIQRLRTGVAPTSRIAAWFDRLTERSKYRLPWFVVAGSAGSGKTSLLTRSGLNLNGPLPAGVRAPSTAECDWWFADDAVLVDTPHDAFDAANGEPPGSSANPHSVWTALTGLLRRYRPRQPLNGVLLTVAADKLIAISATERTAYAEQLVRPLRALQSKIDVRVPVYICVTQMDRLQGFSAWFTSLGPAARETPWGVGYALDDPCPGEPAWPSRNGLAELAKRLGDGLCAMFDVQPELGARAIAYLFPRQFDAVCAAIGAFCESLFRDSRFEARLQLRGIYFTAAGQAGNAGNGPASPDFTLPARCNARAAPDEHTGPFVKPLLRDVLFADTGFVGVSHAEKRRRTRWQIALALIAISILALLVAEWIASYARNRAWLDEVDTHVAAFERDAAEAVSTADPHVLLPMLDTLKALPETSRFDLDSPPLVRYGLGLYQGTRIRAATDGTYQRALREKLLPLLDAHLE
ncbi:IcmF-like protein [Candidatus Burkholderia humilis]|nr:IcmF-like protein [Candidatus Burkholderia humilis]